MLEIFKLVCLITLTIWTVSAQDVKFSLLHIGDINGQLQRFQDGTDPPKPLPAGSTKVAAGGLGSLVGVLKKYENKTDEDKDLHPVVRISTGNLVGGPWLSSLGWKKYSEILQNQYKPEFMTFGFNEFAAGLDNTNDYLTGQDLSTIITNIRDNPARKSLKQLKEFDFFNISNVKIGVVGFVHPLVMNLSNPGDLIFEDVVTELTRVIELTNFTDVKSVIAIGNGNSELAREILDKIPKVKLVMYSAGPGSYSDVSNAYPEKYNEKYIAFSSALKYGASVGSLNFTVDANGNFHREETVSGLLKVDKNSDDTEASDVVAGVLADLDKKGVLAMNFTTLVNLDGSKNACWRSGCNVGNLVADAMIRCAVDTHSDTIPVKNLTGLVAIWHSGSILDNQISPSNNVEGKFCLVDAQQWLPFQTNVHFVQLKGFALKYLFTISAEGITANITGNSDWGQFLQVSSGLEVRYGSSGDSKYLLSLKILRLNESNSVLEDVQDDEVYPVLMPATLFNGRYGYTSAKDILDGFEFKKVGLDDVCLTEYVKATRVFKNGFERRVFIDEEPNKPCPQCKGSNTATTVVLTLVIFILIVVTALGLWLFAWPRFQTWRHSSSFP